MRLDSYKTFQVNWPKVLKEAAWGAVSGVFIGTHYNRGTQAIISASISTLKGIIQDIKGNKKISYKDILSNFFVGFVTGLVSGSGAGKDFWKRAANYEGGYYRIGGALYSNITFVNNTVWKSFLRSSGTYFISLVLSRV